jgi:hypothetical protein
MRTDKNQTVLSIALSRNRIGLAVYRDGFLEYYRGKTLRQFRERRQRSRGLARILRELIGRHSVGELIMPQLNKQQRHSDDLRALYSLSKRIAESEKLSLHLYDQLEVKAAICEGENETEANVELKLIERYPELERYCRAGAEWERRYYRLVFQAIAGGEVRRKEKYANNG